MKKIRMHYELYGDVQGVGLRYTARQVAEVYGLTGFARNEYDGSVTAEIQGTPADVQSFLPALSRASRWIRIERETHREVPLVEEERSFSVY